MCHVNSTDQPVLMTHVHRPIHAHAYEPEPVVQRIPTNGQVYVELHLYMWCEYVSLVRRLYHEGKVKCGDEAMSMSWPSVAGAVCVVPADL